MFRAKFAVLVPAVLLLLLFKVEEISTNTTIGNDLKAPQVNITLNITTTAKASTTVSHGNISVTSPFAQTTTSHTYLAPKFGGVVKRLLYVTLVLSGVIGLYFLVKFCRSGKRKPRKYGVVKTPGDMEMRPLESDDDDDDDVTMFNRKD